MKIKSPLHLFSAVYISLICIFIFVNPLSAQQNTNPQPDTLEAPVNLSEIMLQAELLSKHARAITAQLQDTVQFKSLEAALADLRKSVEAAQIESDFFLKSYPRNWLIQNLISKWTREEEKSLSLNDRLAGHIKKGEEELKKTQELRTVWRKTRNELLKSQVGESLRKPISDLLTDLRNEEKILQSGLRDYLSLQERVSNSRLIISAYLERLHPLLNQDFISIIKRDEAFIWERTGAADTIPIQMQIERAYKFATQDTWDYLKSNVDKISLSVFLGLVLSLFVSYLNRRKQHDAANDESQTEVVKLKNTGIYVYSVTVIIALLILSERPALLTELLLLLFTIPLIVLVVNRSTGIIRFLTASFLILYWIYNLAEFLILDNLLTSYFDFAFAIITAALLGILNANRKNFRAQFPQINDFIQRSFIPSLFVLTLCAIILAAIGFTNLSRALTSGATNFIYLAPVILICSVISRDLFRIFERTQLIKYSALAQKYYSLVYTVIRYGALYLLFITFINSYSLRPLFNTLVKSIWEFGGQFGEFNVTIGGVLSFFAILVVSWAVSVVMQVLLEGEILGRLNLRRGVAMAIGVMVRYFIIVLGFLLAVASTGFDLSKISILAGALGVGIGFGLQNLVANFISGLILIFERPFVVNDTIETDQIEGNVKEIGIRASKILTYDGAEVIIPNSNLISNRLSNYTLSNASRRQLITVRTSIKADPDEVIKILHNIASLHPNILDTPDPFVLFDGQVEQTLQFRLYYWLISEMFKTRSELNLQIYRELKSLGVELPIPVHEIVSSNKNSGDD